MLQKPPYRPVGRANYRRCAFAPTNRAYNKFRDSIRALLAYNVCLILFANEANPRYRLVLAANRDELYSRPTAPVAYWGEAPNVIAGRDIESGGTRGGGARQGGKK